MLVKAMKSLGVNIGTCGVQTVRLRPMLIFEEKHGMFCLVPLSGRFPSVLTPRLSSGLGWIPGQGHREPVAWRGYDVS